MLPVCSTELYMLWAPVFEERLVLGELPNSFLAHCCGFGVAQLVAPIVEFSWLLIGRCLHSLDKVREEVCFEVILSDGWLVGRFFCV
jgi:hypothetical protein